MLSYTVDQAPWPFPALLLPVPCIRGLRKGSVVSVENPKISKATVEELTSLDTLK